MPSPSTPAPPPEAVARLVPADVDLRDPPRHPAARDVWFGVVWSRLGRGDHAWQSWDRVDAPASQPWVAAERGRVLRELGLHAAAERLEEVALQAATDPVDTAMLRISLTADAVGRGDRAAMEWRFEEAVAAVAGLPDGPRAARQRLRLAWVSIEVAYVRGTAPDLTPLLVSDRGRGGALTRDHDHGTAFHRAKSRLFAGLVTGSRPLLRRAAAEAPPVLTWAVHLARADLGETGAAAAARAAWSEIVPPPPYAGEVAATATARRLQAG